MLANLIRAGLATAQRENIKAGSLAVGRVRIMRPVDGRSKVDHAQSVATSITLWCWTVTLAGIG